MEVTFWGTRGSVASPGEDTVKYGGNTTCLEVRLSHNRPIVIDAGTGIRKLGMKLVEQKDKEIHLFLTHPHWDHIQGFPFFSPMYVEGFKIVIHGWPTTNRKVKDTITDQMEGTYFPVDFSQLSADIDFNEIKDYEIMHYGVKLSFLKVNHPVICHSIKIEENNKALVFMTDNELDAVTKNTMITPWEDFVKFCKNTDLLIHDAQFTPQEIKTKKGWGHSSYDRVLQLAQEAQAKQLVLFHYDPEHTDTDIDNILKDCLERISENNYSFKCVAAREGMSILL